MNLVDPSGLCVFGVCPPSPRDIVGSVKKGIKKAANTGFKLAAVPPYAIYYAIYRTQSSLGEHLPGWANYLICRSDEGWLKIDVLLDKGKRWTGSAEPDNDEGVNSGYLPFDIPGVSASPGDPLHGYLPGYDADHDVELYPHHAYPWGAGFGDRNESVAR